MRRLFNRNLNLSLLRGLNKQHAQYLPLTLVAAVLFSIFSCTRPEPAPVLVVVGGDSIPVHVFKERWEMGLRLGGESLDPEKSTLPSLKRKVLQDLIEEELLLKEGSRRGIQVSQEELERKLSELKGTLPQRDFQRLLLEQYIDEAFWLNQLHRNLLIEKLIALEAKNISDPNEQELKDLYQRTRGEWTTPARIRLYQILIDRSDLAENLFRELRSGVNFQTLARKYSKGAEASKGGDMGWVTIQDLPPQLQSAFDLPLNKPSQVISSPFGYHILLVTQRQPQRILSFAEALPLLRRRSQYEKLETARNRLLKELKQSTPVTINVELWREILAAF